MSCTYLTATNTLPLSLSLPEYPELPSKIFCYSGLVRTGQSSLVWVLKISLKIPNFSIFSLQVKKNLFGSGQKVPGSKTDWPLIYCLSKVCLGRVGLGQGPSLLQSPITLKSWSHLVTIFVDKKGVSLSALY